MMASLLLSRILGLARDMVMAGTFGSNWQTDAYTLAFSIPDLLFFLIAGGALSSAFIPVFSEYLHTKREKEAWRIFSSVATVMSLAVLAFIVAAWIFALPLAHRIAPGKPLDQLELIARMSRILLPAQFAFFIGGLMFGTLYARQRFAVPGLGPNVYNIGIIFGAVVLSQFVSPGIVGMAYGALVGACIGNLVIPALEMRKIGVEYRPIIDLKHPGVRKVFKLMLPVVFGLSLPGVYVLIMRAFGSYYPEGTNSWLYYANLLMQAPLGIFGQSLAIAVFPALTQFFAEQRMDMFRRQLASTIRTVLYLTVPVSAFMAVAAPQIVAALYQHGKFTPHDTEMVATALRWFCIGIPAWCLHPVLMRAFFSVQNSITPVVLGTVATALFVGLVYALKGSALGFYSLPLASSISAITLAVLMFTFVIPRTGGLDLFGILLTLAKSTLATLVFAGVTFLVLQTRLGTMSASHKLAAVGLVALLAVPGAAVYLGITKALKMPESSYLDRALAKLGKRREPLPQDGGSIDPMEGA
jgi:putative peptidoglycan lipid II flippase